MRMQAAGRACERHKIVGTAVIPEGWTERAGLEVEFRGNYPSGMGMQKNEWSLSDRGGGQTS